MWLVLCLLTQSVLAAQHVIAMTLGNEVCTTDGVKKIGDDGQPLAGSAQHDHDCCCSATDSAAPSPEFIVAVERNRTSAETLLTAGRLAAQWLAPCSRGPPVLG